MLDIIFLSLHLSFFSVRLTSNAEIAVEYYKCILMAYVIGKLESNRWDKMEMEIGFKSNSKIA